MNRLKLLATATLMALVFTACDEGTPPPVEPPPPPTPVGTISGTVTIDGTASSGITATLSSGATTTTGSGGSFAFSGVEAGTYTVTISGFPEDVTFAQVTQSATIASDGQNVQLNFAGEYIRSSAVVGNVVAADAMMSGGDGQPETLAGVTVTLGGEHAMGETMQTAEDGGFAFTGLRAGTYTVTISDFPEDVSFETVSVEVEVGVGDVGSADFTGHYIRTSAVEGQVVIEGEGLAGVTVTLSGGPADESYTMLTDADGMFRFEELRPGDYTVEIADFDPRDYEFAATSQDVSVDLDETGTVSFTGVLLRTSGIAGRVSVDGMGLGDITVTLSGAADDTTMTDASGQYAFAGLAAGDYTVTIAVDDPAYVFDPMSQDVTVGDDDSQIVSFEGAHDTSASLTAMLFIDEGSGGRNDMHDDGEDAFPSPAMVQALQGLGVPVPASLPVPVILVGPEVNQMTSGVLSLATGQVSFSGLRAGTYQLRVGSLSALLPALPAEAAAILQDYEYGGPADGYTVEIGVGDQATQAVPVDITHTTVHFGVTLRSGENAGHPVPGASVTLYSGDSRVGSGDTGENGEPAMIRFARAGTSGNMVNAGVAVEGLHVAEGMTPVTWDPKSPHTVGTNANDILNLSVSVAISGKTVETMYGGGDPLAAWAITVMSGDDAVEGAPEDLDDDGVESFTAMVDAGDLPVMYSFAVAADQDDELDGGEMIASDTVDYEHTGLMLTGGEVALEAAFATQTLKVYVHHERDQVMGYTGNVLGGDERMSGMVDVQVRYIAESGRSQQFSKDMWDAAKNTKDDKKGGLTFSHLPADKEVIVIAEAAEDANVMVLDPDELATYTDADGAMGGHFGAEGGYSPSVTLCPLQETAPQDHDECASFAFVNTYAVDGQVWKNGVERDKHDGFDTHEITEDPKDPVAVKGIQVDMAPVAGKNLVDEGNSHNSTDKDGDATIPFDFKDMADGVYSVTVPAGWAATAGMGGDKLPKEFLLSDVVDEDGELNIDVTPTTGVLYGTVTDSKGQAVDSVTVDVNGSTDMSDEFGRFIVEGFSAGKDEDGDPARIVTLSGEGISEKTDTLSGFDANELAMMDFAVEGAADIATISGTVTKSGGGGVEGVEISVDGSKLVGLPTSGENKGKLITGSDGSYVAKVVALEAGGTVEVSASADGMSFAPASHEVSAVKDSRISGIDFTAFDHATITGRVLDGDGAPVERVKVTATLVGADDPADSYTTRKTGTFRLSVPFGTYDIEGASDGYGYEYPNGVKRVTVAPGQALAFGDIEATISANGRPPRFTSSASFSVGEGKRTIGTVKAVDDDVDEDGDPVDEITGYTVSGGADMEMFAITAKGVLSWAGADTPPFDDSEDDPKNKYKVEVDATSGEGAREMDATQKITVTVTASGNLVVTLAVAPDSISESGESSTVTASLDRAAESAFYVVVSVGGDNASDVRLSSNKRLFIDEGATKSTGTVTITAINDNDYDGDRDVTVNGALEPASSDIDVKSAKLTVEEDDVGPGRVVLRLAKGRIAETDDATTTDASEHIDTVTAVLSGGTTFDQDVTITVSIDAEAAVATLGGTTLTIAAGTRASTGEVIITAAGDAEDGGNTTVTVSGTATVPDADATDDETNDPDTPEDETTTDPVPEGSRPADVSVVILDDDDAPSSVQDVAAARSTTTDSDATPTYTVTWKAPSNAGTVNGVATEASALTYQYRFERTEVIGDAAWSAETSANTLTAEIELSSLTGVNGDTGTDPVVPGNWRNRSFTVQVRVNGLAGTMMAKEFTTPAAGS